MNIAKQSNPGCTLAVCTASNSQQCGKTAMQLSRSYYIKLYGTAKEKTGDLDYNKLLLREGEIPILLFWGQEQKSPKE